jgi:DNA mismatch repair protein MutS2
MFWEDFSLKGFNREQLQSMGFSYVMQHLEPSNCYGLEKKQQINWYTRQEKDILYSQLEQLGRFIAIQLENPERIESLNRILHRFKEIRGILRKVENAAEFLDETELFELKNFAIDMQHLIQEVGRIGFTFDALSPLDMQAVIKILNPEEQITRTFSIYEEYSPALTTIREEKKAIELRIAAEEDDVANLHLLRRQIAERERIEENQIKSRLAEEIRPHCPALQTNLVYIAELDFIIAKSSLAIRFHGTQPNFIDTQSIQIEGAVNPYVAAALERNGKEFTPVSMQLKNGANVLTGANMGGKTVALATVTLNILLAHCGFYVYASRLDLPVLEYIFYLTSDDQSITQGLSTFGAEIAEVTRLLEEMRTKQGFCALDEFARGTNPEEGQMMVKALLRYAEIHQAFCLVSTHFSGVVMEGMKHFQVVGLKKAELSKDLTVKTRQFYAFLQDLMDFNIEAVEWDSPTPKDALRVAALMGIQEEFLALVNEKYKET